MNEYNLLFGTGLKINENITIHNPKIGDILGENGENESRYYNTVIALTCNPSAYKVQLFDIGIDYEEVSDFSFFCMMCRSLTLKDTSLLLGDIDLSKFELAHDKKIRQDVLVDLERNIVINNVVYMEIADYIRKIHGLEKISDIAGNEHSKKFLIDRERIRLERQKRKPQKSTLLPLISAMVNSADFKYDHTSVKDLPISTFNDSVKRISKIKRYTQFMNGVYAGTIEIKGNLDDDVNWLS